MADQTPEIFVPYAAKETTEVAPGVMVRVTGIGEFPGKGPDRRHDVGAYLKVTSEQGSLAAMIADLDGYIERRAWEIAEAKIDAAHAAARAETDKAKVEAANKCADQAARVQRAEDLAAELRGRDEIRDRIVSRARTKLARALGRPASPLLPLDALAAEAASKLEAADGR